MLCSLPEIVINMLCILSQKVQCLGVIQINSLTHIDDNQRTLRCKHGLDQWLLGVLKCLLLSHEGTQLISVRHPQFDLKGLVPPGAWQHCSFDTTPHLVVQDVVLAEISMHQAALLVQAPHNAHELPVCLAHLRQWKASILHPATYVWFHQI